MHCECLSQLYYHFHEFTWRAHDNGGPSLVFTCVHEYTDRSFWAKQATQRAVITDCKPICWWDHAWQDIFIFIAERFFIWPCMMQQRELTCIVQYIFTSVGVHVTHRPCLVSAWWWLAPPRWACNPESAWPYPAPVWRWSRFRHDPTPWTPLGSLPK